MKKKNTIIALIFAAIMGEMNLAHGQDSSEHPVRVRQPRPPAGDTSYIAQAIGPDFRIVRVEKFKPFSLGGTQDLATAEVERLRQFLASVRPGNRIYGEGSADVIAFEPRVRVRPKRDHAQQVLTGWGRRITASEIALEYGLYLHPLNERIAQPVGNRQITLVEAEPVTKPPTTVINNYYTTVVDTTPHGFFTDLEMKVGVGVVGHTGHIKVVALPQLSGSLSKGSWELSFSFAYWQKQSQNRQWERSSVELAYRPIDTGNFLMGVTVGGATINENDLLSGFHVKQERGLFMGVRPALKLDRRIAIETTAMVGVYNLSQYKAHANEVVTAASFAITVQYEL